MRTTIGQGSPEQVFLRLAAHINSRMKTCVYENVAFQFVMVAAGCGPEFPMPVGHVIESARPINRSIRGQGFVTTVTEPKLFRFPILAGSEHHDFVIAAQWDQFSELV